MLMFSIFSATCILRSTLKMAVEMFQKLNITQVIFDFKLDWGEHFLKKYPGYRIFEAGGGMGGRLAM
jgi:hypothetical protein